MAITTYTFPNQVVPSGTLSFEIRTSEGDGTPVTVTEKYFSSDISITNETEFIGGDILSNTAKLTIENDVDNLFSGTIFSSLYVDGGWVSVKITLGTKILFSGIINKYTVKYDTFYAENDGLDGRLKKINFLCIWHLDLLKFITTQQIRLYILTNPDLYQTLPTLYSGTLVVEPNDGTQITNIAQIIYACLNKLATDYSLTLNLSFSPNIKYTFMRGVLASTGTPSYVFPRPTTFTPPAGSTDIGMALNSAPSVIISDQAGGAFGIFNNEDESGKYIETAYDLLIGILKSFALYITFRINDDYDLFCDMGTRSSGSEVVLSDVVEQSDDLFSDVARDGVNITSLVDGAKYEKKFNVLGDSIYTNENIFDFGNDLEFDGAQDSSLFSLVYPFKSASNTDLLYMVRELGIGDNQLTNPNFDTDLSGWATSDFTFDNSTTPFPFGSAKASLSTSVAKVISQSGTFSENDFSIFDFLVYVSKTSSVTVNLYTAVGLHKTTTTQVLAGQFVFVYDKSRRSGSSRSRNLGTITKVEISILGLTASTDAWIGFTRVLISRQNTPELYGKMVERYFDNPNLTRKRYLLDGVKTEINLSDYFIYNDENYYLKKVNYDLVNNETEIEAINYPY